MAMTVNITQFAGGTNAVNVVYPFDIWDGQSKTVVYKLGNGDANPYWMGAFPYTSEWMASLQNGLYLWKNGVMYEANQANYTEIFGVSYKSRVMCVSNALQSTPKVYNAASVEANMAPTLFYMYTTDPFQQSTDIVDFEWRLYEGIYYANIKRNKLLPTITGYTTSGLLTGQKVRTAALFILVEFQPLQNNPLELRFVNINFDVSKGHRTEQR
jgi:hypothetical protein